MKFDEMKRKVEEIEEINGEIEFLDYISESGIFSISIKPNYGHNRYLENKAIKEWAGEPLTEAINDRLRELHLDKHKLLGQIGAEE